MCLHAAMLGGLTSCVYMYVYIYIYNYIYILSTRYTYIYIYTCIYIYTYSYSYRYCHAKWWKTLPAKSLRGPPPFQSSLYHWIFLVPSSSQCLSSWRDRDPPLCPPQSPWGQRWQHDLIASLTSKGSAIDRTCEADGRRSWAETPRHLASLVGLGMESLGATKGYNQTQPTWRRSVEVPVK